MQDAHMLPAGWANVAVLWYVVRCLVPSHGCVIRLHARHAASERNRCHSQAEFKDLEEKKDKKWNIKAAAVLLQMELSSKEM